MNTVPRQLLTSGTAMAAVVGALLLGAEDTGSFSRKPSSPGSSQWHTAFADMGTPASAQARDTRDAARLTERR